MRVNIRCLALALVLAITSGTACAGVYKWVDSAGKVHYSDQPPANAKTDTVKVKPAATGQQPDQSNAASGKTMADKEMEYRKRKAEAEEQQKKQEKQDEEAKLKQQNCGKAKANLQMLQEGGRVTTYNERGERVYLDDQGRQQAIADAQKNVDSWCK